MGSSNALIVRMTYDNHMLLGHVSDFAQTHAVLPVAVPPSSMARDTTFLFIAMARSYSASSAYGEFDMHVAIACVPNHVGRQPILLPEFFDVADERRVTADRDRHVVDRRTSGPGANAP